MASRTENAVLEAVVRSPGLCETVASQVRETILAGRLKPGERLIEQKMAACLGVAQPTFREALRELEAQGLVSRSAKRGTYVTQLSPEECEEIVETWLPLDTWHFANAPAGSQCRVSRHSKRL